MKDGDKLLAELKAKADRHDKLMELIRLYSMPRYRPAPAEWVIYLAVNNN